MKYAILTLLLLGCVADAYQVTVYVRDINTKQGIEGVNVSGRYHDTTAPFTDYGKNCLTDSNGFALNTNCKAMIWVNYSKAGYYPSLESDYYNITNDTLITKYLTPISTEGIVRLKLSDMTGLNHPFCIYYTENNRLYNCYKSNETEEDILLIVNTGYYIKPVIQPGDALLSSQNMKKAIPYWIEPLLPVAIVIIILSLIIGALWKRR